jgi:hypothetical protein
MTVPPDGQLDEMLASHGRMNFSQACRSSGRLARLTMNDSTLFLAVADSAGTVSQAALASIDVRGTGATRTVVLDAPHDVTFDSDSDCDRFLRVLAVRKDALAPRRTSTPASARAGSGQSARPTGPIARYRQWSDYALAASTLLLAVAWLDLVGGVISAIVLLVNSSPLGALIWVLIAAAGFALPACVGSATRMIVYRFQAEDAARA